jgi:hypothetical protein
MSLMGQSRQFGDVQAISALPLIAEKFFGWRSKIPKAADALRAQRAEGPYRFIQNRSRTSVTALKSDATTV